MKRLFTIVLLLFSLQVQAEPFVDIHTHYNWDQSEIISPQEVADVLRQHGVTLAVVTSTPSLDAAKLRRAAGDWIVPFFSPYITGLSRDTWYRDEKVLPQAKAALESGEFFGIGEVHLYGGGFGARRDNKVFLGLLQLAQTYNVPFMIHTEASSYLFFLPICQQYRDVRFLWAHAGSILPPAQVGKLLQACPNVWVDLSAKDPWHYGNFAADDGRLSEAWLTLLN